MRLFKLFTRRHDEKARAVAEALVVSEAEIILWREYSVCEAEGLVFKRHTI